MTRLPRVLVVEDEPAIRELLGYALAQAGFDPVLAGSAEEGLREIHAELPAVLLLDLMLPGQSGEALARQLRADRRTRNLPILMVTAKAEEADKVAGLEIGADDYLTKPFSPKELIARIRAVLRRRAPHQAGDAVEVGPIQLNPVSRTVLVAGIEVSLSPTEFDLLQFLLSHPNRAFTREQLLNALRGDHRFVEDRTVDVYVRRLRDGLGAGARDMVQTVRGFGYKLVPPSSS